MAVHPLHIHTLKHHSLDHDTVHQLIVKEAGTGWGLIMQSGVLVECATGIPLCNLLEREFAIASDTLQRIDVYLLDGKPVDNPKETLIPNGSRLALAAGLPGIAGLAMKSNSAVRGLRPGITHGLNEQVTMERRDNGIVELALFSLALPLLAMNFLARGITVNASTLIRYLRPGLKGTYEFNAVPLGQAELRSCLAELPNDSQIQCIVTTDL